jgi:hypothetical protein
MIKTLTLLIITACLLPGCDKPAPSTAPQPPGNPPPVITPVVISPSVYIAGDSIGLSVPQLPYPVYWKNGRQVHLPNTAYSSGSGIALSDSDVYVSGYGGYSGDTITYWKNGVGINLRDPTINNPAVRAIVVSGNDVYTLGIAYVNGYDKLVPVYWKNKDNAIKISTFSSSDGDAKDIAVNGNDIYIAGSAFDISAGYGSGSPACFWKNGTPTFLDVATASFGSNGLARSIAVSGTDVHVAGEVYHPGGGLPIGWAVYWKNGVASELTASTQRSQANAVTLVNNDVYIAGAIFAADNQPRATYWKNGVPVSLDNRYSVANDISVYENDIYVVGRRGLDTAIYWKNGVPVILGKGSANAIIVRK